MKPLGSSRRQVQKKPTWQNTRRRSTTSAYSSTGRPAGPGYPLSSHPTTSHPRSIRADSRLSMSLYRLRSGETKDLLGDCHNPLWPGRQLSTILSHPRSEAPPRNALLARLCLARASALIAMIANSVRGKTPSESKSACLRVQAEPGKQCVPRRSRRSLGTSGTRPSASRSARATRG